jgi:cob(I)alamin adenosyltransferase
MARMYTALGDDGYTGLLGEGRLAKYDPRIEAVGALDEATAALGLARATCHAPRSAGLILTAQRDLYGMMAEVSADSENAARFRTINAGRVKWIEDEVDAISEVVEMPREFIVPGDTPGSAALSMARTIVRRAERRVALLVHQELVENREILRYLNRLSSLCFVLELHEVQAATSHKATLAKV